MAGNKPLSWQWKLVIGLVVATLVFIGFAFSSGGNDWFKEKIDASYNETPAAERRASSMADRYLFLAWWRGNIIGDKATAMAWYKDFCGITPINNQSFFATWKLNGKCSEDGQQGWGPMHPRAPDAYYAFLDLMEGETSSQMLAEECYNYYKLFYMWMKAKSPTHQPHPSFHKYWTKISNKLAGMRPQRPPPPGVDMKAPEAPAYDGE